MESENDDNENCNVVCPVCEKRKEYSKLYFQNDENKSRNLINSYKRYYNCSDEIASIILEQNIKLKKMKEKNPLYYVNSYRNKILDERKKLLNQK